MNFWLYEPDGVTRVQYGVEFAYAMTVAGPSALCVLFGSWALCSYRRKSRLEWGLVAFGFSLPAYCFFMLARFC